MANTGPGRHGRAGEPLAIFRTEETRRDHRARAYCHVMTFSIVAADDEGRTGVAVATCVMSVGRVVPWVRAGVGAVATQSFVRIAYGPELLDLLADGIDPEFALQSELRRDDSADHRQVAVVTARGELAAWTGSSCVPSAGDRQGEKVSVQGNMLANDTVVPAMLDAYQSTRAPLPERLLAALSAGDQAGGDLRGRQSAALVVGDPHANGDRWERVTVNLRVDDHREPIPELARLLDLKRRYEAIPLVEEGRGPTNADAYQRLADVAPDPHATLYRVLALEAAGETDRARGLARELRKRPGWGEFLARGMSERLFPVSEALREASED